MAITDDERRDLQKIINLFDRVASWDQIPNSPTGPWRVEPGSALAGDDAKTAPYHVSHRAWHHITAAIEHLQCFRDSLITYRTSARIDTAIRSHSQHTLLRCALENAAITVWQLYPDRRLDRVVRRLRLEMGEINNRVALQRLAERIEGGQSITPLTPSAEQRRERLRRLAVDAGLDAEVAKKASSLKAPAYSEIVEAAGAAVGPGGPDPKIPGFVGRR